MDSESVARILAKYYPSTWTPDDKSALMALCNAADRTFLSDRLPYPYTEADADLRKRPKTQVPPAQNRGAQAKTAKNASRGPGETRGAPGRSQKNPVLRTEDAGEPIGTHRGPVLWMEATEKPAGTRRGPFWWMEGAQAP